MVIEVFEVCEICNCELMIFYGEVLLVEEFFDLIWCLMWFDKYGLLDLIFYYDNCEELWKWVCNLICEMLVDWLYEWLLGWFVDI